MRVGVCLWLSGGVLVSILGELFDEVLQSFEVEFDQIEGLSCSGDDVEDEGYYAGVSQIGVCRRGVVGGIIVRWFVVGVVFSGVELLFVQGQFGYGGVVDVFVVDWVGVRNFSLDIFGVSVFEEEWYYLVGVVGGVLFVGWSGVFGVGLWFLSVSFICVGEVVGFVVSGYDEQGFFLGGVLVNLGDGGVDSCVEVFECLDRFVFEFFGGVGIECVFNQVFGLVGFVEIVGGDVVVVYVVIDYVDDVFWVRSSSVCWDDKVGGQGGSGYCGYVNVQSVSIDQNFFYD